MIGLDTNVLLRWLIDDPRLGEDAAGQGASAARVLGGAQEKIFVNRIVLAESAWVLRRRLRLERAEVVAVVEGLLTAVGVDIEDEPIVRDALEGFRRGPGDFADHLVGAVNAANGCRTTYTFDRAASKTGYFSPLPVTKA